jgi:hypothetical protein
VLRTQYRFGEEVKEREVRQASGYSSMSCTLMKRGIGNQTVVAWEHNARHIALRLHQHVRVIRSFVCSTTTTNAARTYQGNERSHGKSLGSHSTAPRLLPFRLDARRFIRTDPAPRQPQLQYVALRRHAELSG